MASALRQPRGSSRLAQARTPSPAPPAQAHQHGGHVLHGTGANLDSLFQQTRPNSWFLSTKNRSFQFRKWLRAPPRGEADVALLTPTFPTGLWGQSVSAGDPSSPSDHPTHSLCHVGTHTQDRPPTARRECGKPSAGLAGPFQLQFMLWLLNPCQSNRNKIYLEPVHLFRQSTMGTGKRKARWAP